MKSEKQLHSEGRVLNRLRDQAKKNTITDNQQQNPQRTLEEAGN